MFVTLADYVGTSKMLRIERSMAAEPSLNGFLLALSPVLGLMHCFDDFDPDGYTIFRIEDVLSHERGPHEVHWERMLRSEGLLNGQNLPCKIDLSSFPAALRSIQTHYADLIVECEDDGEEEQAFYLGRIIEVGADHISLHYVDALGHWDENASTIALERITKVQFDTRYLQRFMRYVEPFPAH